MIVGLEGEREAVQVWVSDVDADEAWMQGMRASCENVSRQHRSQCWQHLLKEERPLPLRQHYHACAFPQKINSHWNSHGTLFTAQDSTDIVLSLTWQEHERNLLFCKSSTFKSLFWVMTSQYSPMLVAPFTGLLPQVDIKIFCVHSKHKLINKRETPLKHTN